MSNGPVNKQREAAAPFRDGEPDSMDINKDSRPEHSPYASQVCAVYFQGNGPLHIPHALLHQSVELTSLPGIQVGNAPHSRFCANHLSPTILVYYHLGNGAHSQNLSHFLNYQGLFGNGARFPLVRSIQPIITLFKSRVGIGANAVAR
jgi:hypothetical protein